MVLMFWREGVMRGYCLFYIWNTRFAFYCIGVVVWVHVLCWYFHPVQYGGYQKNMHSEELPYVASFTVSTT